MFIFSLETQEEEKRDEEDTKAQKKEECVTFLGNRWKISTTTPPPPLNVGVDVVAYALHATSERESDGSRFECVGGQQRKEKRGGVGHARLSAKVKKEKKKGNLFSVSLSLSQWSYGIYL